MRRNLPGVSGCKGLPPLSLRGAERRNETFGRRKNLCAGAVCAGCALVRGAQGAQKFAGCQRVQGPPPTVIARSGATRQSVLLAVKQNEQSNTLGESEKRHKFALRIANLQSFSAGTRIATPVCALVRNDMLKEEACARVQGRLARKVRRNLAGVRGCRDVWRARCAETCRVSAGARAAPHCHCEERSDVAIRSPRSKAKRKAILWANSWVVTNSP